MATSTSRIPRVFLDSSVLFAAAYSDRGSAHDLLLAATEGRIALVLSEYVIDETQRNVLRRASHLHTAFGFLRDDLPYRLADPTDALIVDTARVVVAKDAPVIAAARTARVRIVATYDRRHLLSRRDEILAAFGITVATPSEILSALPNP